MKNLAIICLPMFFLTACKPHQPNHSETISIARGQMPAVAKDEDQDIHLVYGSGDSLMYTFSKDKASTFSTPQVIHTLSGLVASSTRGPQIAVIENGLVTIALNQTGNIFSYVKDQSGKWMKTAKINDADTTNKEGFLGLSSDGKNNLFAIWPDLRNDKHNKIYGARSTDGGKSWHKNILVYASPDSTVCECCRPSVAMSGNNVFVMFRNWLNGNRDLYVIQSSDAGETFGEAHRLGSGSWALNGCPMDGGGIAINDKGILQTVWRRQSKIYSCEPGKEEKEIGVGRSCSIETIHSRNLYTWSENGDIICLLPDGSKKTIGKGSLPILKSVDENEVVCIWENGKRIEGYVLHL